MENVKVIQSNKELSGSEEEVLEQFKLFQQAIIDKDELNLKELLHDDFVLIHMSGKKESKTEFIEDIKDNTLNYYHSTIQAPSLNVGEDVAELFADITLDAKVYGIKGVWTLHSRVTFKIEDNSWLVTGWDN